MPKKVENKLSDEKISRVEIENGFESFDFDPEGLRNQWDSLGIGIDVVEIAVPAHVFEGAYSALRKKRKTDIKRQLAFLRISTLPDFRELRKRIDYSKRKKKDELRFFRVFNAKREENFFAKLKNDFQKTDDEGNYLFPREFAFFFWQIYAFGQGLMQKRLAETDGNFYNGISKAAKKENTDLAKVLKESMPVHIASVQNTLSIFRIYGAAVNYFAKEAMRFWQEIDVGKENCLKGKCDEFYSCFSKQDFDGAYTLKELLGRFGTSKFESRIDKVPKNWKTIKSYLNELAENHLLYFSNFSAQEKTNFENIKDKTNFEEKYVWNLPKFLDSYFTTLTIGQKSASQEEWEKKLEQYLTIDNRPDAPVFFAVSGILYPLLYKEEIVKEKEKKLKRDFVYLFSMFQKTVYKQTTPPAELNFFSAP